MFSTTELPVQAVLWKISESVSLLDASVAPRGTSQEVSLHLCYNSFSIGLMMAPKRQRIYTGLCHVRNRAPFLGGNFCLWGGLFSATECLMIYYRQQDDPLNAIVGGVITGGLLSIRGGASIAFKQACIGGVILMLIEGVQVIWMAHQTRM